MIEEKPKLNNKISLQDFKDFYWLKAELVSFCKENNINRSGGKIEITNRIIYFIETGKNLGKTKINAQKSKSNFNWNIEKLSCETVITDNYKNTENVRQFFTVEIGKHFKFNVLFIHWIKQNIGKTLKDAIEEWNRIYILKKDKNYKSEIGIQFEYNTYIRDFLEDNPKMSIRDAKKYWMLKREIRGSMKYTKSDLELIVNNE